MENAKRIKDETLHMQNRIIEIQRQSETKEWETVKTIEYVQSTMYYKKKLVINYIESGEIVMHIEAI